MGFWCRSFVFIVKHLPIKSQTLYESFFYIYSNSFHDFKGLISYIISAFDGVWAWNSVTLSEEDCFADRLDCLTPTTH
jgi:hypothetical protein